MLEDDEDGDNSTEAEIYEVREKVKHELKEAEDCVIVSPSVQQKPTSHQAAIRQLSPYSMLQVKSQVSNKRKRANPSSSVTQLQQSSTFHLPTTSKETPPPAKVRSPIDALQITSYATTKEPQSPPVSSTNESHEENRQSSNEDDEIFAKYITSELRQIKDPHVKRIVKHKIQNIIFEGHCSLMQK